MGSLVEPYLQRKWLRLYSYLYDATAINQKTITAWTSTWPPTSLFT